MILHTTFFLLILLENVTLQNLKLLPNNPVCITRSPCVTLRHKVYRVLGKSVLLFLNMTNL